MGIAKLKKAICKDYIPWFQLYDILEKVEQCRGCQGLGDGGRDAYMELGDFYCVKVLGMILYGQYMPLYVSQNSCNVQYKEWTQM